MSFGLGLISGLGGALGSGLGQKIMGLFGGNNTGIITINPNTIKQNELQINVAKDTPIGQSVILKPEDIGTWKIIGEAITITTNKVPEGEIWYIRSIQTINRITLGQSVILTPEDIGTWKIIGEAITITTNVS